jgi:hypothetical protein
MKTAIERFEDRAHPEPNSGCFLWAGKSINPRYGYGGFFLDGKNIPAHRAAWMLFRGPIPAAMEIDHLCRTPACVNPEHLRVVTKAENLRHRAKTKARCRRGHPLVDGNLYLDRNGEVRRCKICRDQSRLKRRKS